MKVRRQASQRRPYWLHAQKQLQFMFYCLYYMFFPLQLTISAQTHVPNPNSRPQPKLTIPTQTHVNKLTIPTQTHDPNPNSRPQPKLAIPTQTHVPKLTIPTQTRDPNPNSPSQPKLTIPTFWHIPRAIANT